MLYLKSFRLPSIGDEEGFFSGLRQKLMNNVRKYYEFFKAHDGEF